MNSEISWIPIEWICSSCEKAYFPSLFTGGNIDISDIQHTMATDNIEEIKQAYYEHFSLIGAGIFQDKCDHCGNEIKYRAVFELNNPNDDFRKYSIQTYEIYASSDLDHYQNGFIFRGTDIYSALSSLLVKWWMTEKDIYIANPFITTEGWKMFTSVGKYIANYNYRLFKIKPIRDPFKKIIIQKKQGDYGNTPETYLKKAMNDITNELSEVDRYMKNPSLALFANCLYLTSPKNQVNKDDASHIKNSGKFHIKLYAGLSRSESDMVITSYNLTEYEYLQMESFSYIRGLKDAYVLKEISKLLDDKYMDVEKSGT